MVFTVAVRMGDRRAGRRAVLAGALGLAGLAACQKPDRTPAVWSPGPRSAESVLVEAVAMAGRYAATITAHPTVAAELAELRDAHLAHADLLTRTLGRRDLASPSPSTGASVSPPVPADYDAATAALLAAEKVAAEQARVACLAAPAWQAGTLAAISAGRATHVAVLSL